MSPVTPIPEDRILDAENPAGFLEQLRDPNRLIYFLLNVGDGDTQLVVLPGQPGRKRAMVVDVANAQRNKLPKLVLALQAAGVLHPPADQATPVSERPIPIVVGTHPHDDHIGGMAEFLRIFGSQVDEYWDAGYYHPTEAFIETMKQLEDHPHIVWTQPSAGMRRFIDDVRISVLGPGISLKNQYDSYGVDPNNASVTLKLEYPFRRVQERTARVANEPVPADERLAGRLYAKIPRVRSLVLSGDAQARAWSQVQVDFPKLEPRFSPVFDALQMARGVDPLEADVFKIPHHGSKRGVYLELLEMLNPKICLVSSVSSGGRYHFPHWVAQDAIREARQKIAAKPEEARRDDYELGLYYTSDSLKRGDGSLHPLGSLAVVISPAQNRSPEVWRFGDATHRDVNLNRARRLRHPTD